MKIIRVINEELIDLREFKKPNFVFCTNEYSNSEDFCTFHEQINPFDLYYENEQKDKEIERLNNIINMAIVAINIYQDSKTLSIGYKDLKRIRGILRGDDFDIQMFEEYLKELKESGNNE